MHNCKFAAVHMSPGTRTDLEPSANLQNVSQSEAAEMLNVSERSVSTAILPPLIVRLLEFEHADYHLIRVQICTLLGQKLPKQVNQHDSSKSNAGLAKKDILKGKPHEATSPTDSPDKPSNADADMAAAISNLADSINHFARALNSKE
jgi:hypothetical protein